MRATREDPTVFNGPNSPDPEADIISTLPRHRSSRANQTTSQVKVNCPDASEDDSDEEASHIASSPLVDPCSLPPSTYSHQQRKPLPTETQPRTSTRNPVLGKRSSQAVDVASTAGSQGPRSVKRPRNIHSQVDFTRGLNNEVQDQLQRLFDRHNAWS